MASLCSMSAESSSSLGKHELCLNTEPTGTRKIHYQAGEEWDFDLESHRPIDLSLNLPHYRARLQPIDHRLSMSISGGNAPIKLKVCRTVPRARFYLEVHASYSNVTIWVPSDFNGHIRHTGKASFSAGFVNRMLGNVHLNEEMYEEWGGDEIVVGTAGTVTFRMWDTHTGAPENAKKETWKRMFGCTKKAPETAINWDFLLDD
ncbi:hypothetical protein SERLA73DRAFT_185903 [Serpula lacrymans var. lacrymans S7.3]|uniref:DUF7330 domain-containing protein n=2 Tax=Serpula lacrymans var. lacrymans TaxID=341189 RepID=F8Q6L7_SERL3|nr:uncharacterized protein SERLADRAFT_474665 [Serpula lacrymans var. lacrymans S7.9]EGN96255.1 hypothetical protein SERLA73DRAFT_185903 [Serpula lacrymans var. lacrymans S7.3]EGO21794.1 hypothetical protein SERLADRAFT_474665 [Serpula lacrymans var. lacrymans S7.9]